MAVGGKALVISLDCVNAALLDQWTATGRLPNLARLRSSGTVARVTCNSVSIEADWHTLYTGRQPSEHGHCSYDEIIPGTYRSRMTTAPRVVCKPFWETLSQEGAQVIALNPVHAAPAPIPNGIVITDWLIHDAGHYTDGGQLPPEFVANLLARYPADPVNPNDWGHSVNADPGRLLAAKSETLRRKTEVLGELLQSRAWDVCYVGFDECHEMSHLFWHLHDPSHPRHHAAPGAETPAAMLTEMDKPSAASLPTSMRIARSSSYRSAASRRTIIGRIWSTRSCAASTIPATVRARLQGSPRLVEPVPHTVQRSLFGLRHQLSRRAAGAGPPQAAGLRLAAERASWRRADQSRRARAERPGRPGAEYDAVCQDLSEVFKALVVRRTGAPLVRAVVKTRDVLEGPYLDRLPDLMIEWNVDQPIAADVATNRRDHPRLYGCQDRPPHQ